MQSPAPRSNVPCSDSSKPHPAANRHKGKDHAQRCPLFCIVFPMRKLIRRAAVVLSFGLWAAPAYAQQEMIVAHTRCAVVNGQLVLTLIDTVTPIYLVS